MKVLLTGKIINVGEVEQKDKFKSQRIRLEVLQFDSKTGEKKTSQFFDISLFNNKIEEFKADNFKGQFVSVGCYLRSLPSEHEGKTYYNIVLNGNNIVPA